jgi:transaldolase
VTKLHELYRDVGQSPWLDNLKRDWLVGGPASELAKLVGQGIRGVTSNPTIFQKAISAGTAYDLQFKQLIEKHSVEDAYWELVIKDIEDALAVLRPVHGESGGEDGFVSIEVSPAIANDTAATIEDANHLHKRINEPNLLVKIPATAAGVPAIQEMFSRGKSINITLIFSLTRYEQVIDAYFDGLEAYEGQDLSKVHSVASFFVSRVDTEVDRRLEAIGSPEALDLRGRAAVAQAKLAYKLFRRKFSGERWEALARRGARVQRPLWASTSTKNPDYPDLLYVDTLEGPDTVNTLPDATIEAFLDHGVVARTIDVGVDAAESDLERIEAHGISMDDVAATLEEEGVASFVKSYNELLQALTDKANTLAAER